MTTNWVALATLSLLALGCGDDSGLGPDSGVPGDDTGVGTSVPDTGGLGTARTAMLRFVDQDENPLEGVNVAIDTDLGRFEGQSDSAGELALDYRYMLDSTDSIAALEGYRIIARLDTVYEAPDTADGYLERTLPALDPDIGDVVRIVAGATGVPTGGRWCVAPVSYFRACQDEGVTWDQRLGVRQFDFRIQDYVYAYALDDTGALYDFASADWTVMPDGARSVTVAFDGTFDVTPTERDFTINYPSDPDSPFRTETLDETWQGWVEAVEPTTYLIRSALTMVAVGTDAVTMRVHSFPIPGDELMWKASPFANQAASARSFTWYSGMPPATIDILDLPRVRSGATWTDEFEWTAPAPDVERYFIVFTNNAAVIAIALSTPNTFATVPPLPSGYDPMISFPFPGSPGDAQVSANRGDRPPDETAADPYRVDGEASWSMRHPITF